ncbi:MAG: amidohydrolase family protein, partial [Clostridiales bacterium]|nr:amidohydrolase family protein [Clostridiales bacterium]
GADRVMFGADYPMWKPQLDIDCLMEMGLTDSEYRRIFWDNAAKVFGLEETR